MKNKVHIDTVLAYRQRFLDDFGKQESLPKFLQQSGQTNVDWDAILAREQQEVNDEKRRGGGRK